MDLCVRSLRKNCNREDSFVARSYIVASQNVPVCVQIRSASPSKSACELRKNPGMNENVKLHFLQVDLAAAQTFRL